MSNHSYTIATSSAQVGDIVELTGDEAHHAVTVKRTDVGEVIDLLDGAGMRLVAKVTATSKDTLSAVVLERYQEQAPVHPVGLIQALAKSDRDLQAVEASVELGISRIMPWQADRSIVRWNAAKADKALAKWRSQVRSAQKQSRRSFEPEVLSLHTTKQLVQFIEQQVQAGDLVLVLHEQARLPLAQRLTQVEATGGIWLIVGPEGGISEAELEAFISVGAHAVVLGSHVLRASTAGPAALVLVRHLLGELN